MRLRDESMNADRREAPTTQAEPASPTASSRGTHMTTVIFFRCPRCGAEATLAMIGTATCLRCDRAMRPVKNGPHADLDVRPPHPTRQPRFIRAPATLDMEQP